MQKIHHFHKGLLCLVLTCHIFKGHACLFLYIYLRSALAHTHEPAALAHFSEKETEQQPHQADRQYHCNQNGNDRVQKPCCLRLNIHIMIQKPLGQLIVLHPDRIVVLGRNAHSAPEILLLPEDGTSSCSV